MTGQEKAMPPVEERIESLEMRVNELAELLLNHTAHVATLLVGWDEISRYCRKSRRTLGRYVQTMAFPAYRWGRHVVSSPHTIDAWFLAVRAAKRAHQAVTHTLNLSDQELSNRLRELERQVNDEPPE